MAKSTTRFFCTDCGHEELRWLGQCPACQAWNTFTEMKIAPAAGASKGARGYSATSKRPVGFGGETRGPGAPAGAAPRPVPLSQVQSAASRRLPVEPAEVARVLGGGLVEGSVVLLGGEPGVGKSTLLTGLALWWVRQGIRVVYLAGEESPSQIRMRAERLGFRPDREPGFLILPEVHLETILPRWTSPCLRRQAGVTMPAYPR